MDINNIQEGEYELQHYGFTSIEFFKNYKIYVTKAVGDLLNNMETSALSNVYTVQSKMEINKQFEALRNLYSLKLEGVIDGVEQIIKETFKIPDIVLLECDAVQDLCCTDEELENLQTKIKTLEEEYLKSKLMVAFLENELEMFEKITSTVNFTSNIIDKYFKNENKSKENNDLNVTRLKENSKTEQNFKFV